jgi:3-oxoacyl-[acyl-carrier-protein] synthase III
MKTTPAHVGLPARISGCGAYLPSRIVTNEELEPALGLTSGWIEQRTGVRERRRCTTESVSFMAANAALDALAMAGISSSDLTAIIGASSTPLQAIPCTAVFVQRELGAPEGATACFDVNATCLSFLAALDVAARLVAGGAHQHVLICSSERTEHSMNPDEPESAVLFGDGAAAVVVSHADATASAVHVTRMRTWHSGAELSQIEGGGTLHHPNDPATTRAQNYFAMRGPQLFRKAAPLVRPFIDSLCDEAGWTRDDVAAVVPHQASRHGIELGWTMLGFRKSQIVINLPTRGNCIAASMPLALTEAVLSGRITRGDRVLLFGVAAGLSLGGCALTF